MPRGEFLKVGDEVRIDVEGRGTLVNRMVPDVKSRLQASRLGRRRNPDLGRFGRQRRRSKSEEEVLECITVGQPDLGNPV
jgi:hypothetical protein